MDDGVSLEALHRLVPAAEEEDLLDEVAAEREAAQLRALQAEGLADEDPPPPVEPPAEPQDEPRPTHWQALGVVQQHLGGEVLPPDGQPGDR